MVTLDPRRPARTGIVAPVPGEATCALRDLS